MASKKSSKEGKEEESSEEGGLSLDDAFADDDDVEYAKAKPKKEKKKKKEEEFDDEESDDSESPAPTPIPDSIEEIKIKASKTITKLKKGDKIKVDALNLEVDTHEVLIDHGSTKEISIDCFDPKTDKDYQLRYFSDQPERTMELYELQEIMYIKKPLKKVEW